MARTSWRAWRSGGGRSSTSAMRAGSSKNTPPPSRSGMPSGTEHDLLDIRFNPENPDQARALRAIVPDLVVLSSEPQSSLSERLQRWLHLARYVLLDTIDDLLRDQLDRFEREES